MQDIIKKINEKLKINNWYDELRMFLESSDFSGIIGELKKKVEIEKQRFCPSLGNAFRFMEELSPDKIKVVIFIDCSCNKFEQADGIPLSVLKKDTLDVSPFIVYNSIKDCKNVSKDWVDQGVFIIPLSLTSRINGKSHKKLWEPFIMRLIEVINKKHPDIPWVLFGEDTFKYEEDIVSIHTRLVELKKPLEDKEWYKWINNHLIRQEKSIINW